MEQSLQKWKSELLEQAEDVLVSGDYSNCTVDNKKKVDHKFCQTWAFQDTCEDGIEERSCVKDGHFKLGQKSSQWQWVESNFQRCRAKVQGGHAGLLVRPSVPTMLPVWGGKWGRVVRIYWSGGRLWYQLYQRYRLPSTVSAIGRSRNIFRVIGTMQELRDMIQLNGHYMSWKALWKDVSHVRRSLPPSHRMKLSIFERWYKL